MYLAPLNYDRFFKKVFSDPKISQKFLEDFLNINIDDIEILKERHKITDDATFVEFDFRCKIGEMYVIVDMQQWYKADMAQRIYMYHALNTGLQLEALPKKKIVLDAGGMTIKKVKDYKYLEPVYTLIWMVHDTFRFEEDYVSFQMTPEIVVEFLTSEKLWKEPKIVELMIEREKAINILKNDTKGLDFLPKNRLVFAFQKNIVRNKKIERYYKWFEFAEKTRNKDNKAEDFEEYKDKKPFEEMMHRLNKSELSGDDLEYIKIESESWEEVLRFGMEHYEEGKKEGRKEGRKEGEIIGQIKIYEQLLNMPSLPEEVRKNIKQELIVLRSRF
ncbi:MAG: hypothetical protein HQK79_17900 [Desulfobacterales bacterium]|nr:hypothetical protein [Desulfobacterales bacterium]